MFKPAPRIPAGLLVIAIAVTIGAAALVWTVLESRQAVRKEVLQGHALESQLAAGAVAAELTGDLTALRQLSKRRLLIQAALEENWPGTDYHLQDLLSVNPEFGSAAILDASGKLRALHPPDPALLGEDFSQHQHYAEASSGTGYVSDLLDRGDAVASEVAVAVPIRAEWGELVGLLIVTIPIDQFDFSADLMSPQGGSIIVIDRQGRPVASIGETMTGPSLAQSRVVKKALQGESGAEEGRLPGRDGTRLVGFAPVEELGWGVVAESPSRVALAQVSALTWRLVGVLGLTLLGGLAAGISTIRLVRRLDRLRRESSAIVTSMGDAILITDSDWHIMWANPALEALSGWRAEEVRDRLTHDVYRTFDERGEQVVFGSEIADSPTAKGRLTLESRDGNRVPIQTTTAPILDEKGNRLGYVVVGRDVSREREIDALKSALVSTVSHELRTPLTMIQGFSELLLRRELDEERSRKAATEINVSAERLSRLIDDLLSVSRIESGRMELDLAALDLREMVEEVIRPFSAREGSRFQIKVDDLEVRADKDRMMQILTNLVSNAVKYSEADSPVVITAHASGASAEIAVIDRGIGMSQAEMTSAFEMFSRVDRPEVKNVGGTGLGLYITRSLVEAHGGQIWIENQPGGGTRFAFTLPLASTRPKAKEMAGEAPAERGFE